MGIKENLERIWKELPGHIKLVAVSKTMPVADLMEAYNAGQRIFGENKAQELINKQPHLPADVHWHFIGHLQTNKVKYLVPFISMIQTVDSLKLLEEINKQAGKCNRIINCLLQFHIAEEETKFGLDLAEAAEIIESADFANFKNICVCGVMGMASFTTDHEQVRKEFKHLHEIFQKLKVEYFNENEGFKEISMGMSGDYLLAIEEGSTIVRIGSAIFGERNY